MKYKNRHQVVDVFQWTGDGQSLPAWLHLRMQQREAWVLVHTVGNTDSDVLLVRDAAGDIINMAPGEYLTCDSAGRVYGYTENAFHELFEELMAPDLADQLHDALSALNERVHNGYDFNRDPDNITLMVGEALATYAKARC